MKTSEMSTAEIASHLKGMTRTGMYKEAPPAARAIFEEAINRLRANSMNEYKDCPHCPHSEGDGCERDCAFPDCVGGWEVAFHVTERRNSDLLDKVVDAFEALEAAKKLFDEALPKLSWGASAVDANALRLVKEVPGQVEKALLGRTKETTDGKVSL